MHTQPCPSPAIDSADLTLLGQFQHDFPLVAQPFDQIGAQLGLDGELVLERLRECQRMGQLSRIGAVWNAGAGGAAALCALAAPPARLAAVAELVNRHPGVNHNYEREHHWNLWYVLTGADAAAVRATAAQIADWTALPALFLPMVRAYRIDLGFDLRQSAALPHVGERPAGTRARAVPVAVEDERLAALVEDGLPLIPRPYDAWAQALGRTPERIQQTMARWLEAGTLRRFGVVVRHHDLGICANAMTVLDVPDEVVDAEGARLAMQAGITLCYRRERHRDWPYNLYFMVHGQDRRAVSELIEQAIAQAGLSGRPRQTLFSGQRFKQTGGSYFRDSAVTQNAEQAHEQIA